MLSPNDDQQIIRDSAARFVRNATAGELPRQRDASADIWASMANMGWLALALDEADGGLGGGAADVCALALELGRGLMVGSLGMGAILAGQLAAGAPAGEMRSRLLTELICGSRVLAVADAEPRSRGGWASVTLHARKSAGEWVLDGVKTNIWAPAETRSLLVSAAADHAGEMLAIVTLDSPGLAVREFPTIDAGRALECTFTSVRIPGSQVLAPPSVQVRKLREVAWDFTSVVMVAECVGMMKSLITRTAEHLQSRKQFGKALAQFQVLRHRMADMALVARRAEVLGDRVARQFATFDSQERSRLVAAACVKGLAGARFVAEQAIQLHGGMGMTAELPVGRYLRRSVALEATFGSPEHHRVRFQEISS
jgi:alkylation response protein AidB-like acyl-CoA dehydrogenase